MGDRKLTTIELAEELARHRPYRNELLDALVVRAIGELRRLDGENDDLRRVVAQYRRREDGLPALPDIELARVNGLLGQLQRALYPGVGSTEGLDIPIAEQVRRVERLREAEAEAFRLRNELAMERSRWRDE